jgi:putative endonuclease
LENLQGETLMLYIIQFERPLGNPNNSRGQAQFYLGYCEDNQLERRVKRHRMGQGAAITRAAVRAGITFEVIITMPGDRQKERQLKRQKNTPRLVRRMLAQAQKCEAGV